MNTNHTTNSLIAWHLSGISVHGNELPVQIEHLSYSNNVGGGLLQRPFSYF